MGVSEDSQQLRRLAQAVAVGELARDEYRRQRRVLIERHAGDAPVGAPSAGAARDDREHTLPNAPAVPSAGEGDGRVRRARAALRDPAEDVPAGAAGGRGDLWIGVVVVAVVLAVVGALLAFLW